MFRSPIRRFHIAILVVLSLLFSQLALASYICPGSAEGEEAVMEMAPGEPCEGMAPDQERTVLCYQHCTDAPQSFDAVKLPTLSLPAIVQVLLVPLSLEAASEATARPPGLGEPQPPPEPVFLATLRLRV
jgi:hypothetical protein